MAAIQIAPKFVRLATAGLAFVLCFGVSLATTVGTGSNVLFSVTASGTQPFSYQWQKNGIAIPGATASALTLSWAQTSFGALQSSDTYAVVVSNSAGSATASTTLVTLATPVNDSFATATVISGSMAILRGTNVSASKEASEPIHAGNAGGASVWWKWVAPQSGLFKVDTTGSNFDTLLAVYTGSAVYALTPVASNDNIGGTATTSYLSFQAVSGTTYYIAVDGSNGMTGSILLQLTNQSDFLPAYPVSTLAGTAGSANTTDGTGTAAKFHNPAGIARDSSGNFYVADRLNHTIRKITSAGVVTTIAGTAGTSGNTDGAGTAAKFNNPLSVAVDTAGNIYVADSGNDTIRVINAGGNVSTLAGSAGVLGSIDGLGSTARFNAPSGIAVDAAGNIYVADSGNHTIRMITPGGAVSTLAGIAGALGSTDGTGTAARFNNPTGLAVDGASNIYVADYGNNLIRRVAPGAVVSTLAGSPGLVGTTDGLGGAARFSSPAGVAVDSAGNIYVADYGNHTIRFITTGGLVSTVAGSAGILGSTNGTGIAAKFNNPRGLVVDPTGNFYVADYSNHLIRKTALVAGNATFTSQPPSKTGMIGGSVTLTAAGTSWTAAALQWYKVVNGVGQIIPGATGATLTLTNLQASDAGSYYVVATNTSGSVTSTVVMVTIGPGIVGQTVSQTVLPHASAHFSVTASGSPAPTYQWQRMPAGTGVWSNLTNTATYSGSTTATLTVSNTTVQMNHDQFQCVVTNSVGSTPSVPATLSLSPGDFDGNGCTDIIWENTSTGNYSIWLTDNSIVDDGTPLGTPFLTYADPAVWRIAGTGDFNGDGQTDIVWENMVTGDHAIWLMNGTTVANFAYLAYVPTNWHIAAIADFNGDGQPDILWEDTTTTSPTSGFRSIWLMNGINIAGFSPPLYVDPGMHIAGAADVNGDGQPDIFFECTVANNPFTPGDRIIFLMQGTVVSDFLYLTHQNPAWRIANVADFDGDGQTDILWENTTTGDHTFWLMDPIYANWSVSPNYGRLATPYFILEPTFLQVEP